MMSLTVRLFLQFTVLYTCRGIIRSTLVLHFQAADYNYSAAILHLKYFKINEGKCPYGSCSNHGVGHGDQCGAWKQLTCDTTTEFECCECDEDQARAFGGCVGEDAYSAADGASCGDKCEAFCNALTSNTQVSLQKAFSV